MLDHYFVVNWGVMFVARKQFISICMKIKLEWTLIHMVAMLVGLCAGSEYGAVVEKI